MIQIFISNGKSIFIFLSADFFAIYKNDGPPQQFKFLLFPLIRDFLWLQTAVCYWWKCWCPILDVCPKSHVKYVHVSWVFLLFIIFFNFCLPRCVIWIHFRRSVSSIRFLNTILAKWKAFKPHSLTLTLMYRLILLLEQFVGGLLSLNHIYHSNYKTSWRPHPQPEPTHLPPCTTLSEICTWDHWSLLSITTPSSPTPPPPFPCVSWPNITLSW